MNYTSYQKQAILERALAHPISDEVLARGYRFDSVEQAVEDWLYSAYEADRNILNINEFIKTAFIVHWKENAIDKGGLIEHEDKVYEVELLEQALEDFEDQRKNGVVNHYEE